MDIITVGLKFIDDLKININEYLTLLKINQFEKGVTIPFRVHESDFDGLIEKGFLKLESENDDEIIFTAKAENLFNNTDELFYQFYDLFPNKVPNGMGGFRAVSALSSASLSSRTTKKLWDKMTKGDTALQLTIIQSLRKELKDKTSTNSMKYLANVDTWLRQCTWEKWLEDGEDNLLRGESNEKQL